MAPVRPWPYSAHAACPTCYSWIPRDSPCAHERDICPTCGREQCLLHWPYPMRSAAEAAHFLKAAEVRTGGPCFVAPVVRRRGPRVAVQWKIFTSQEDRHSYMETGRHRR